MVLEHVELARLLRSIVRPVLLTLMASAPKRLPAKGFILNQLPCRPLALIIFAPACLLAFRLLHCLLHILPLLLMLHVLHIMVQAGC